jgi:uncharacterized repeat protein (TIGR01451 family)
MTEQEDTRKKPRRDLLLVLLILPLGILCMFMTGQAAIRLAPEWVLEANMRSMLDPNATFAALGIPPIIEPLNPAILTRPAWGGLFLTPQAAIPTRVVAVFSPTPINTPPPPPPPIATPIENPEPTATLPGLIILPTSVGPSYSDLAIQVSDNSPTYTPGTQITYTIIVTNLGPDDAPRFNIIDNIPAVITGLTVTCAPANLCGTNTSSGNTISFTGARLPAIGTNQITIAIRGTVISSATGILVNTASINIPSGVRVRDPSTDNNSSTDRDTQLSVYDVAVTKTDGTDTYTATDLINYIITVTNSGPSDAIGITIADEKPSQITSWGWCVTPCVPNPTATNNALSNTRNIPSGGSIQYAVSAIPSGLPEVIHNTVRLVIPSGPGAIDERDSSNNTFTDIDIPYIDLQITKTDVPPSVTYMPGGILTYSVTVTNNSTFNLTGITVTDNIPTLIDPLTWSWICSPAPGSIGASCTSGPSNTSINDTVVNLPSNTSVVYSITATVLGTATGDVINTASVVPPSGLVDSVPDNNTATDTNRNAEYVLGPPDGNITTPATGTFVDFTLSVPITIDGNTSDYEIVLYERLVPPDTIQVDQVQIQISTDGATWYTVYFWGDGIVDTNASPPGSTNEPDNFVISTSVLYGSPPYQTGILIDADGSSWAPPNGTYQFIRVTCPDIPPPDPSDIDGVCDIDTIEVWP